MNNPLNFKLKMILSGVVTFFIMIWLLSERTERIKLNAANERAKKLEKLEQFDWEQAVSTNDIFHVRRYIKKYPEGSYIKRAKRLATRIANERWRNKSLSWSINEIKYFLDQYPENTIAEGELESNWEWVQSQDDIAEYKKFVARFPNHSKAIWINKRIIDLEIQQIANSGKYLPLRPIQKSKNETVLGNPKITSKNDTFYYLTVRCSGPSSKKIIIPPGGTKSFNLFPGAYKIAVSASGRNVRDYYGEQTYSLNGFYSSTYYIRSSNVRDF